MPKALGARGEITRQTIVKVATTTALVLGVRLALLRQPNRLAIGGGRHA